MTARRGVRKEESGEGGANNCKDGDRKESMHRHTHSAFRRCNPSNRSMLLAVLAASVQCSLQEDKYQEGFKCYQLAVSAQKGGCTGTVRVSSCADTSRASMMQAEVAKVWFEGKAPDHCKSYFNSVCLGVGGTAKIEPPNCAFACTAPGCRRDEDCTNSKYKPVICCESHRKKYLDNCNAVNTGTLENILAEMKKQGDCADVDCYQLNASPGRGSQVVTVFAAALVALLLASLT